jgi:hypothetical protein
MSKRMPHYGLKNTQLVIRQDYNEFNSNTLAQLNQDLRTGILEDLYAKNEELIQNKDSRIALLEKELIRYRSMNSQSVDIGKEMSVVNPHVSEFSLSLSPVHDLENSKTDTLYLAYVRMNKRPNRREIQQMEDWLKIRTKARSLRLVIQ